MYESYFGLKERPFSLSPDPRFIYLTTQHQEALAKCQYTIDQKMGVSAIHGDIGAGKTSLARRLWEQYAANNNYRFAMLVHPNFPTPFQLLKEVRREFGEGVPRRSLVDMLDDFQEFLIEQHRHERTVVLVVDEAHRLRPPLFELLRQFLNFETSTEKLLQIVLFGQNELATKLDRQPELKDRVTIFGALTSLTRKDVEELIAFRWRVAGSKRRHPFADDALEAIYVYSKGLPRRICKLCDNALIRVFSAKQREVGADLIAQVAKEARIDDGQSELTLKKSGPKPKKAKQKR
jgi:general secretion pathway protein A